MNFCTSEAWKCPGSSVSRRKRAESACAAPCCDACCAEAGAIARTRAAVAANDASRRAWGVRFIRELSGLGVDTREAQRTVRRALRAGEHGVGLGVVHEALGLRVPGEGTVQLHRDPAHDARR